jgi:hypothetical protein
VNRPRAFLADQLISARIYAVQRERSAAIALSQISIIFLRVTYARERRCTTVAAIKGLQLYESAEQAGITERFLRKLIAQGEGPVVTELGARRVILESDHNAWLKSRRIKSTRKSKADTKSATRAAAPGT